jgi:predicted metalloprotease with PDZ domain
VENSELPDYGRILEPAGLVVEKVAPGQPWVGGFLGAGQAGRGGRGGRGGAAAPATAAPEAARIASAPANTPLYAAGLDAGDVITAVDGKPIQSAADFAAAVAAHKPGDVLSVDYTSIAGAQKTRITVGENPQVRVETYEQAGRTPSAAQLAFRRSWLASKYNAGQ